MKYNPNLKCEYKLEASPNDYVQIEFQDPFKIEGGKCISSLDTQFFPRLLLDATNLKLNFDNILT